MSDGANGDNQPSSRRGGGQGEQQELASKTKTFRIQSKRFYLTANRRGKFIKMAEAGGDGRRSKLYMALSKAAEFRDHLIFFCDYNASLDPPNPENLPEDGKLESKVMEKTNSRYYLDFKENTRGRFLRVVCQSIYGGPRYQIAIPAQGMIKFRDALTSLLEEFGTDDGGLRGELPEGL